MYYYGAKRVKTSHHPKHTYAGIVKSQLLQFHRMRTRKEDFVAAVKLLFHTLTTRVYCRSFLRCYLKTFSQSRPVYVSSLLPIITNYSKSAVYLIRQLKYNFNQNIKDAGIVQDHRPIVAFRRNRNLMDLLVKAKHTH